MKKLELYFGNSEKRKEQISNLLKKHFPNIEITDEKQVEENPFQPEVISNYGTIRIEESQEEQFNIFFKEYKQLLR